ncbi:hypothetical protein [Novacetimonas hansenii]|uniref:hypothetical protein n=1 Tax=Novacetimonas hansenii TaxID=436 RepID=UPI0023DD2107|nr:hypothetical protein [Novacetimonas hansenii]WEQ60572.1 hypothetical protein LV563_14710 [Novacetimonas hansenii]
MANIFEDPKKASRKAQLFEAGIHALENDGWQVEKIPGFGKGSVRKITKGSQERDRINQDDAGSMDCVSEE